MEGMARVPLNALQLEALTWVRDGAPNGVYEDYRPRIVARALHRHGAYPPAQGTPQPAPTSASTTRAPSKDPSPAPTEPKPKKPPRVGPTDAMMHALTAAADHQITIEYDQTRRYEQLVRTAERFEKIPEGMQVTVTSDYRARTAHVRLEPLPEWRTRLLAPIPVPGTLRDSSDVVTALQGRDDLDIRAREKKRALRLVQALVAEARRRGYQVKAVRAPVKNRWRYVERSEETSGHFKIKLGPDTYRLSVYQLTEQVEHVASKSELARAGRGYAVPKWDRLPTERLGLRIDTTGLSFWGQAWTDRDDRPLDDALAQILQELELRHDAATQRRVEEERQRLERERQWEAARDHAIQALTESHRAEILLDQAARWRNVAAIRGYVKALETHVLDAPESEARETGLAWAQWAREYADRIDPLQQPVRRPR